MKKYIFLTAFCLIYYWPVELPILCLVGGYYGIKRYEHRQVNEYNSIPGTFPPVSAPRYIQQVDTIYTWGGQKMEFYHDTLIDDEE